MTANYIIKTVKEALTNHEHVDDEDIMVIDVKALACSFGVFPKTYNYRYERKKDGE
jgi:hypothetical protein